MHTPRPGFAQLQVDGELLDDAQAAESTGSEDLTEGDFPLAR